MGYRVIQWATGNVGRAALRAVARHPELELVGLHVTDPAKDGRDAGELCRLPPFGVAATRDASALLALEADCVLHMPLPSARVGDDPDRDLRDLCRILASGKNVVTTVGFVFPAAHGEKVVERLQRACREGGSSLHGTGVNPGWLGELLPLTLSALSSRIERIAVLESTDFSFYPSREVIVDIMGLGKTREAYATDAARYEGWLTGLFRESVELVAAGLALPLDGVETEVELALAEDDFDVAAGRIAKGTVAGQRFRWTGRSGGVERIVLEAVYRAQRGVAPGWPAPGAAVTIEGRPRMHFELDESWISNGLTATAMHAVHAVPAVCRAEPGIRTFLDLPLLVGRYAFADAAQSRAS
ncbi:MAG: dihydrodipicolinate reductase [Myxococcota bacterium]|nr:dihydrodipicolinate reductase [Myxococcota bacterium]